MAGSNISDQLSLRGEIVEIYEKDDKRFAKINFNSGYLDLLIKNISQVHLSDKVIVKLRINVENISQEIERT